MTQYPLNFDCASVVVAPSASVLARETSALAGVENLPRRATQNARILMLIRAAGETGLSDLELHRATGISRQSICVRRFDLRTLLEPAGRYTDPVTHRSYTRWRVGR